MSELKPIIEALLLAAEEPLSLNGLTKIIIDKKAESQPTKADIKGVLDEMIEEYAESAHGIHIVEVNGGYQFRTKQAYAHWIHQLNNPKAIRLSKPAVESLAIIAYRQPITRGEVDHIRGVDSGAVMKGLLERRLLKIVGRKEEPGRPLLYGTTPDFLELFGLKDLKELPPLKELEQQAQEMIRRSREVEEEGEEGLHGLEVDISDLEWLDEKEKEVFSELDTKLSDLKSADKKTQEIITPSENVAQASPETPETTPEETSVTD